MNEQEFWKIRSKKYNDLKWVNEKKYIDAFINSVNFKKNDYVLDVGTGTGVIAHNIAPKVKEVIGLDISQDMLNNSNWKNNKYFIHRDINDSIFCDNIFDKITARMVFHHIMKGTQNAMDECYRILKPGGYMILSEGIPPTPELADEYSKIFSMKEKRLTFSKDILVNLMKNSKFKNIKVTKFIMKGFSVKNWLENSGLPLKIQAKIFEIHVVNSDAFKKAYNMKIINGDCIIDILNLIIVGKK